VSDITGFNVFAISFLLVGGATDNAAVWAGLTAAERSSALSEYHAAGISLVVSAFGSTNTPTSSGYNPTSLAQTIASWVTEYTLDGVDIDYEDFTAFNGGTAEAWLVTFTQELRSLLPEGQYIITHAPVAPWFSPNIWTNGGYLYINEQVGSLIDWYNVQFYNQGTTEYTTCSGLLTASSSTWPESALFQIAANGVSLNKLVIGKPATSADASNGYIAPATLAGCVEQAQSQGWSGGVMTWQYPDAGSAWIEAVRADSWPVGGGGTSTTSIATTATTTTTSATSTGTGSSGGCSGVSAWSSAVAYTSGNEVSYGGDLWVANQWNEDEVPGGSSGAWNNDGAC